MKTRLLRIGAALAILLAAGAIALVIRNSVFGDQIEREWQASRVDKMPSLGTTRSLEIMPLFDEAASRQDLEAEHGVSYLIRTDHLVILMDAGMNPARLSHNMAALGVDEKSFDVFARSPPPARFPPACRAHRRSRNGLARRDCRPADRPSTTG